MSETESSTSTVFRVRADCKISKSQRHNKCAPTPVNVIIWAMEILGKRTRGVALRNIQSLIKKHFILPCRNRDVDRKIETACMFAEYFGILENSNDMYYLKRHNLLSFKMHSKSRLKMT